MPDLTPEALERLLAWLDPDATVAAHQYEIIRARLIRFFIEHGLTDSAEELVDRTIDRIAAWVLNTKKETPLKREKYFLAAARVVLIEYERRESKFFDVGDRFRRKLKIDRPPSGGVDSVDSRGFRRKKLGSPKAGKTPPVRSRVVSTGFCSPAAPDSPIDPKIPLRVATTYYFWFEIGKAQKGSIESKPTDIPAIPANALLTIVLFGFKDGLVIVPGADVGVVEVQSNGKVLVKEQPQKQNPPASTRLQHRLFFPVQTPGKAGVFRMRCNIYWGQTLLQSRLVEARVTTAQRQRALKTKALNSVLDYKISRQLDPAHITKLNQHRLSVLLNKNEDGSHSFHFYGAKGVKQEDVRFDAGELDNMLGQARGTLRIASWGDADEWRAGVAYRYKDRKPNLDRLKEDLVNLAMWGYEFYTLVRSRLAGGEEGVADFEEVLSQPGHLQFAMKESPRYILPAAMIYDQPLDTGADQYSLCPNFVKAFQQADSLETLECLNGNCPTRNDLTTVCPSGFWGFRHYIGLPLSVENGADVVSEVAVKGNLKMAAGVATDLQLLKTHLPVMQKLRSKLIWNDADNRDRVFRLLKDSPHLVYFYCHGGLVRNSPYLQLGPKEKPSRIQRSNFYAYEIVWKETRPLIFINGCHTTAVAPTQALEFITPLVTYSRSAGVIGTEITIFEELATVFAEDCLRRFSGGESIGQAIRNARLTLLKEGNPLGLVYIPFVLSGLTLIDGSSPPSPN